MIQFYICPVVMVRMPYSQSDSHKSPVGKVWLHRAALERYSFHRGLGELVLCSLTDPSITTQAGIAADQDCIEWPDRDLLWLSEVGATRRKNLSEALSALGAPMAWADGRTTAGEVLNMALQLGMRRQRGELPPIANGPANPNAEKEMYREIHDKRVPLLIQGVRL